VQNKSQADKGNVSRVTQAAGAAAEESTGQVPGPAVHDDVLRSQSSTTPSGTEVDEESVRRTLGQPRGANEVAKTRKPEERDG
jgi:hypothetical protein